MNRNAAQEIRKTTSQRESKYIRNARERRFVRKAIIVSSAVMAAILAGIAGFIQIRPVVITQRAQTALTAGRYGDARALYEQLPNDPEALEMIKECDYQIALGLLENSDFEKAAVAFSALESYKDAKTMIDECYYRKATALYDAGDYTAAEAGFIALSGYSDAVRMYDECEYMLAAAALESGDEDTALLKYLALGDFRDAEDHAAEIAVMITGESDPEKALQTIKGLSQTEVEHYALLTEARGRLPIGFLAAGFFHTVCVSGNGTVLAAGLNEDGQCYVSGWTDIVAVAAGAYHTVGLRDDGRVVATGNNEFGQCDVSGWDHVVQIAANDYGTFGLRGDGTVLVCGFGDFSSLSGWIDVTRIAAGSYIAAAIRNNGSCIASHPSAQPKDWLGLVDLDVSTGYAVGVLANGTVLSTFCDLSEWTDVVAVSAGTTAILAVTSDGDVLARFFRSSDAMSFDGVDGVVAAASGGTHYVFLTLEGTVLAYGDNTYGQCDTGAWRIVLN